MLCKIAATTDARSTRPFASRFVLPLHPAFGIFGCLRHCVFAARVPVPVSPHTHNGCRSLNYAVLTRLHAYYGFVCLGPLIAAVLIFAEATAVAAAKQTKKSGRGRGRDGPLHLIEDHDRLRRRCFHHIVGETRARQKGATKTGWAVGFFLVPSTLAVPFLSGDLVRRNPHKFGAHHNASTTNKHCCPRDACHAPPRLGQEPS